jgi:hypothetical protein
MLVYGRLAADMCAWTEIARSGIFAESKDMFSRRINGLAVEDPIVHTSVEKAAPDMTRGKPTATRATLGPQKGAGVRATA